MSIHKSFKINKPITANVTRDFILGKIRVNKGDKVYVSKHTRINKEDWYLLQRVEEVKKDNIVTETLIDFIWSTNKNFKFDYDYINSNFSFDLNRS